MVRSFDDGSDKRKEKAAIYRPKFGPNSSRALKSRPANQRDPLSATERILLASAVESVRAAAAGGGRSQMEGPGSDAVIATTAT